MVRLDPDQQRRLMLNAAEAVILRQGLNGLTLDAVAAEAGMSKGGLLHHFPSKDKLIEALVLRSASDWRNCYTEAYEQSPEGPGRQVRGVMNHCLGDCSGWTQELQRSTSACFAALFQNPELIAPMREAYAELHQRVEQDGLPPGVGYAVTAAIDGLWLYWVLGLADVDQELVSKVRAALEDFLDHAMAEAAEAQAAD